MKIVFKNESEINTFQNSSTAERHWRESSPSPGHGGWRDGLQPEGAMGRDTHSCNLLVPARLGKRWDESHCLRPLKWRGTGAHACRANQGNHWESDADIKTRVQRGQNNRINYLMNQRQDKIKEQRIHARGRKQHDSRRDPRLVGVAGRKDWTQNANWQKSDPNILRLQNHTLWIRRQKGMYCANTRQTDRHHRNIHNTGQSPAPWPQRTENSAQPWASENSNSTGATERGPEKPQRPCFSTTRVREGTTRETRAQDEAEEKEGGKDGNKSQLHRNQMTETHQQNKN